MTPKTSTSAEQAGDAAQISDARSGRHAFIRSANPRQHDCVRCGRPASAHLHPELRRVTLVTHLQAALKAIREDDEAMCRIHVGAAQKVLEEH